MGKIARAAVMTKINGDLEIREYPLPWVEKGTILVKVTCCTICGSDILAWSGRKKAPVPMILGHEIVGRIAELGEGVAYDSGNRPLKAGDRITWTIMDSCGKCYYCREKGLMMKCLNLKKYGHDAGRTECGLPRRGGRAQRPPAGDRLGEIPSHPCDSQRGRSSGIN